MLSVPARHPRYVHRAVKMAVKLDKMGSVVGTAKSTFFKLRKERKQEKREED
jgi:hypothetical protein